MVEASAVMVAAVLAVRLALIEAGMPPATRLALCIVVGALVVSAGVRVADAGVRREFDGIRRRFGRPRAPVGGAQPSEP